MMPGGKKQFFCAPLLMYPYLHCAAVLKKPLFSPQPDELCNRPVCRLVAGLIVARKPSKVQQIHRTKNSLMSEPVQDAFLREVQSDLQREKVRQLGRRYGLPVMIVLIAAALGLTGWQFWQAQHTKRLTETSLRYEAALTAAQQGQDAAVRETLRQLAASNDGGYAVLAALKVAASTPDDLSLLNTLTADTRLDSMARDAAAVLAGYRATGPVPGAVRARLETLGGGTGPWQYLAQEALALNALQAGLIADARKRLTGLQNDPTLPAPTASRVAALLASLPAETQRLGKKS
jgi:hypothetical protein